MGNLLRSEWPTDRLHDEGSSSRESETSDQYSTAAAASAAVRLLEALGVHPAEDTSVRTIRIRNLRSRKYKLLDDLVVSLEENAGEFLAYSYDTGQYGHGFSPDDALLHLSSIIEEYYELLREDRDNLSDVLASHLRYLDAVLVECYEEA